MSKADATPTEKLFGSKTRAKLLQLFFENPEKSFYVREMTRVIDEQINSVRRELLNLESIGIIKNETFDNKIYYSANTKHPFARPLADMFSKKLDSASTQEVRRTTWEDTCRPVKNYLNALVVTNRLQVKTASISSLSATTRPESLPVGLKSSRRSRVSPSIASYYHQMITPIARVYVTGLSWTFSRWRLPTSTTQTIS